MKPSYWSAVMGFVVRTDIIGPDGRLLMGKSLLNVPKRKAKTRKPVDKTRSGT